MRTTRKILSIITILAALGMLAITLTVPSIAAAAPAILTLGLAILAWALWPKRQKVIVVQQTPDQVS